MRWWLSELRRKTAARAKKGSKRSRNGGSSRTTRTIASSAVRIRTSLPACKCMRDVREMRLRSRMELGPAVDQHRR